MSNNNNFQPAVHLDASSEAAHTAAPPSPLHAEAVQSLATRPTTKVDTLGQLLNSADRAQDALIGGRPEGPSAYAKASSPIFTDNTTGKQFMVLSNPYTASKNQYSPTAIAAADNKVLHGDKA